MRLGRLFAVLLFSFKGQKLDGSSYLSQRDCKPRRYVTMRADDTLVYRGSRLRRSRTCFSRAL